MSARDDLRALEDTVEGGIFRENPDADVRAATSAWLERAESVVASAVARAADARPGSPASRSMIAAVGAGRVRRRALASSEHASVLIATARGGSLLERRAAIARLCELAEREPIEPESVPRPSAEPELERDLLLLRSMLRGSSARDARASLLAQRELSERFEASLAVVLDGSSSGDPYAELDPDERALLMLHARALGDLAFAFVCDRIAQLLDSDRTNEAIERLTALRAGADPRALPVLAAALLDDSRSEVRSEAARALGRIDDARVVPLLAQTYALASDQGERIALAEALGIWGDFRGSDAIAEGLSDPREPTRIAALEALADPALAERAVPLARAGDPEIRRAALRAIGRAGDERALEWLHELETAASPLASGLAAEVAGARQAILARAEMRGEAPADLLARARRQVDKRMRAALAPPLSRKLGSPPTKRHRFAAWLLIVRALLLRLFGRRETASELFDRALAADPGWHRPALLQARMWDRAGDTARSVAAYRRVLAISPERIAGDGRQLTLIATAYLARVEQLLADERVEVARALVDELSIHDLSALPSSLRRALRRQRRGLGSRSLPDVEERGAA